MQFNIEVLSVTPPAKTNNARGGYNTIEVAYRDLTDNGKVTARKLIDLFAKEAYATLVNAKAGEQYTIVAEKNEGDKYWAWKSATPGVSESTGRSVSAAPKVASGDSSGARASSPPGRVVGNTYETPEERKLRRDFEALKHRQIGRQGCVNSAIAFLSASKKALTVQDVLEVAQQFEKYAFGVSVLSRDEAERAISEMSDDIPQ